METYPVKVAIELEPGRPLTLEVAGGLPEMKQRRLHRHIASTSWRVRKKSRRVAGPVVAGGIAGSEGSHRQWPHEKHTAAPTTGAKSVRPCTAEFGSCCPSRWGVNNSRRSPGVG